MVNHSLAKNFKRSVLICTVALTLVLLVLLKQTVPAETPPPLKNPNPQENTGQAIDRQRFSAADNPNNPMPHFVAPRRVADSAKSH